MKFRFKSRRGGAAVELALSMLLIVPVFMYALFLDDLLRFTLDLQEAVLSTGWDFTIQNYNKALPTKNGASQVQSNARLMFCDHESGHEAFDGEDGSSADCNGEEHHKHDVVAHICWLNGNAKQITCPDADTSVGALSDSLYSTYKDKHQPYAGMWHIRGQTCHRCPELPVSSPER